MFTVEWLLFILLILHVKINEEKTVVLVFFSFHSQVNRAYNVGDYAAALRYSNFAKCFYI